VKLPLKKRKTSKKKKRKVPMRCRTVRDKRTGRRRKVCKPAPRKIVKPKAKAAPVPKAQPRLPVPSAAAPPVVVAAAPAAPAPKRAPAPAPKPPAAAPAAPAPPPPPPTPDLPAPPTPVHGTLSRADAQRLLWRAGFGPRPGDADRLAGQDAQAVVRSLTRVSGTATLTGAAPADERGNRIDPHNVWGHDHLWWMDRMVRSEHQLVERMALIWHDWFATTNSDVGNASLMLAQNELFRRHALGSFLELTTDVTRDGAMLVFLNGIDNRRGRPNENYARELMELFTLGADRDAYTETDVRELARALTGWRVDWVEPVGFTNFRFDAGRYDGGIKTLWAGTPHERRGNFAWTHAVRLCLDHPLHPSFFVRKLWSYFIPTPPDTETQAALERHYVESGFQIRPIVEAILLHPDLYEGAPLVKPPVVHAAGMLRARGRVIDTDDWSWRCPQAGQQLFHPPNVSGWNDQAWLDTATVRGRWNLVYEILEAEYIDGWRTEYSATETTAEAVESALQFWDRPTISQETRAELERFAAEAIPAVLYSGHRGVYRAMRQNALRHLVAASPDHQLS
jgi:uncharacterized protein (DUF1800 family)